MELIEISSFLSGNCHFAREIRKIGCSQSTTINGGSSRRISCKQPCRRWINTDRLGEIAGIKKKEKKISKSKKK